MKAVTFNIKQDIETVGNAINYVLSEIKNQHDVNEETIFEIKVILNELVANSLFHGNQCVGEKNVYVSYKLIKNLLFICVKDDGEGFDYKMKMKTLKDCIEKRNDSFCERGRGLIIVKSLSDKLKFNKCGNGVIVMKYLQ